MDIVESTWNSVLLDSFCIANVQPGSVLEPTQSQAANGHRRLLPPPRSRSPIKTSLGSSPRRSLGPPSSPRRNVQASPSRSLFNQSTGAGFADETLPELLPTIPSSARKPTRPSPISSPSTNKLKHAKSAQKPPPKNRKRVFSLSDDDEEDERNTGEASTMEIENDALKESQAEEQGLDETGELGVTALEEDDVVQATEVQDEDAPVEEESIEEEPVVEEPIQELLEKTAPMTKKRGRPKQSQQEAAPPQKRHKRSSREKAATPPAVDAQQVPKKRGRPGRPPKNTKPEVSQEVEEEVEAGPSKPTKRPKTVKVPKAKLPAPSQRDSNASIISADTSKKTKSWGKGKEKAVESTPPPQSPEDSEHSSEPPPSKRTAGNKPKPRGLLLTRSETPATDHGAQMTRTGRRSVKPLAFWRNEKAVFAPPKVENGRLSLGGIEEIVRTEEIDLPTRSRRRGAGVSRKRAAIQQDEEEEDEDEEPWESEGGILLGPVMQWDPMEAKGIEENLEEVELAFAPKGLEESTRDVKRETFRYAKTITLPFFHSGMVVIPPDGEKRMKNARKNHMVFWVFSGRVAVNVSNNEFSVGRGGMWQVPRGMCFHS